jgi:hypothetical protein
MMTRRLGPRAVGLATAAAAILGAPAATAERAQNMADGVYGRFDGDVDLSLAAGGAIVRGASGGAALGRLLFLETAGVYTTFTDAFGTTPGAERRSLAVGVGVRPLFLPRWGYNLDRGPAILDLSVDAITLDLGVLWTSDERGRFTQRPGVELALGTEVPLFGQAEGLWIGARGALRWRASELAGGDDSLGPALFVTLSWHFIANLHVIDVGDRLAR